MKNVKTCNVYSLFCKYICTYPYVVPLRRILIPIQGLFRHFSLPESIFRIAMDKADSSNLWAKAMESEIQSLHDQDTFVVLEEGQHIPPGYKQIPYHCIYNANFDVRRKCRLVAGGHMTDPPDEKIFSGVVSMETVRICFTIAKMNDLEVCAGDIGNEYLYGKTKEKVYVIAGPEFGDELKGKTLVIHKALYGLKSSSAQFHEHLSATLLSMGYKPSKADYDLWMKHVGDHYEYIVRYVNDVIVFSKDPMSVIEELKKIYVMKDIGKPRYYLGGDVVALGPEWEK